MSNEVIKKVTVLQADLPTIKSSNQSYDVRYRIVSEDKNRHSHFSPIFNLQPNYTYVSGNINIGSSVPTTIAWDPVTIKIGTTVVRQAKDYDVWVRWSKSNANGDYIYAERISGTSISLVHPTTYFDNGVDQAQAPDRLTVEVYLKGTPISRDYNNLLVYSPAIHTI